jgi:hypothetical protein
LLPGPPVIFGYLSQPRHERPLEHIDRYWAEASQRTRSAAA